MIIAKAKVIVVVYFAIFCCCENVI